MVINKADTRFVEIIINDIEQSHAREYYLNASDLMSPQVIVAKENTNAEAISANYCQESSMEYL